MISFGPIPSRRLGKSLGINNILSPKVCTYGCIYCQVGKTAIKSTRREVFFQPEVIFEEVGKHLQRLNDKNYPDYLTIVSNGEPTLDINLGRTIKELKKFKIPIAVITNSSLLYDKSVRNDLMKADLVSLKIDASDNLTWKRINHPSHTLSFEKLIENICLFTINYPGAVLTETMLVDGINDTQENFSELANIIKKVNPVKAFLAIPTRPPAETSLKVPGADKLNLAWQIFNEKQINVEFLIDFEGIAIGFTGNIYEDILNITTVHPLREDSLLELLKNNNSDFHVVESLIRQNLIKPTVFNGNKFYIRDYHLR
jgi:wyosine [tRNA(Phe)-imidazoG37] synthetase (radical SAM superfamily)